jgi:hypothetical protein
MTPNDVKDILNGLGKWSIGIGLIASAVYFVETDRISAEVISVGATAAIAFYFGGRKN